MNRTPSNRHTPTTSATDAHEAALIQRIGTKDRDALAELYAIYHRRLARFLGRFIRQYEVVQEIVNDTLFIVWQQAAHFRGSSRVSTWIMGIAYRRALRSLRQSAAQPLVHGAFDEGVPGSDALEEEEQRELLMRAMETLPLEQRLVLELTYYLGHSCEEIAAIVECPVNTVKTRMFHARRKLKGILPRLSGTDPE